MLHPQSGLEMGDDMVLPADSGYSCSESVPIGWTEDLTLIPNTLRGFEVDT